MKISFLSFALLTLLACGCTNKNLYKNIKAEHEQESTVLSRKYVYATRAIDPEAGGHPVEQGTPVVTKNNVFVFSESNGVEAFERSLFQKKWALPIKNGVVSEPLLYENNLYFGAMDGNFYAVDSEFGKVLWKFETKVPVFSKPTIVEGKILFNASDDVVYCLDSNTGKWLWHYRRGGNFITTVRGNSTPVSTQGKVYVGFSDGYVVSLNLKDGNLRWEAKIHKGTKFTDVDASGLLNEGKLYIPSYDGELYCLDSGTGKILWHVDVGGSKKILQEESTLYLASSFGAVYALNASSGKILWKFDLDEGTPTNLVLKKNYLAFGSSTQYFYSIHKGDGSLAYRFDTGLRSGFSSNPAAYDKDIFILSNYGNLYQFQWNL